jgi:hypothetical protein
MRLVTLKLIVSGLEMRIEQMRVMMPWVMHCPKGLKV